MSKYLKSGFTLKSEGRAGFTLIELLIVMAILGVLAVVVLVAINPAEQLRRARDAGRISAVNQLGRAITSYYVAQQAYPTPTAPGWSQQIVSSQDIQRFPAAVAPTTTDAWCSQAVVNGYCYNTALGADGFPYAVVFSFLVSQQQQSKCPSLNPYSVFSTYDGRGGTVCGTPSITTPNTYQ